MKKTKRINNKKRKTRKYYGGRNTLDKEDKNRDKEDKEEKNNGIMGMISNKLYNFSKDTTKYITDKGLRLVGLETIKKEADNEDNEDNEDNKDNEDLKNEISSVNNKIEEIGNASSEMVSGILSDAKKIGSDIVDVVDKSSAALVGQVNDVLESPKIENSIGEAVEETAEIGNKLLENVNEKLNNPILKKETEIVLDNVGDYAEIAVDAIDKPLNKGIDSLNEAGTKAISGISSGAMRVGTDILSAVPGIGAVVELGKILNDGSKAVSEVVEAGKDTATTVSEIVKETNENIHEGIEKLEENKKEITNKFKDLNKDGKKITSRIDKSLNEFENPFPSSGGRKTRNKFLGNKFKKTKRVRFAV